MLAQYINNGENVVTSVERHVRTHVDQICLPQVIISANYDVFVENFFSPERAVPSSTLMVTQKLLFIYNHHLLNLLKLIYHNLLCYFGALQSFFVFVLSIFQNLHAL